MGEARRRRLLGLTVNRVAPRPKPNLVKDGKGVEHDLSLARPSCRRCLGTGVQATVVTGDKRACTICRCVTDAEEMLSQVVEEPPGLVG